MRKKPERLETLEREREREQYFNKIGFCFCAENKINIKINKMIGYLEKPKSFF